MPELPEVEYAARQLRAAVVGRMVREVKALHPSQRRGLPPRDIARVRGATIESVERRGKHQLLRLSTGDTLVVHFRMTGDWLLDSSDGSVPRFARVVIGLDDGVRISLVDPRALSTVRVVRRDGRGMPELGPDAADPTVSVDTFGAALERRRVAIKVALLDQRVLAGVGNIYAAEALWLARIDPRVPASSLSRARRARLLDAIRAVLAKAEGVGERYRDDSGRFEVYGREGEPCTRCGARIRRLHQAGRSTYYCPRCQRR